MMCFVLCLPRWCNLSLAWLVEIAFQWHTVHLCMSMSPLCPGALPSDSVLFWFIFLSLSCQLAGAIDSSSDPHPWHEDSSWVSRAVSYTFLLSCCFSLMIPLGGISVCVCVCVWHIMKVLLAFTKVNLFHEIELIVAHCRTFQTVGKNFFVCFEETTVGYQPQKPTSDAHQWYTSSPTPLILVPCLSLVPLPGRCLSRAKPRRRRRSQTLRAPWPRSRRPRPSRRTAAAAAWRR